MLKRNETRTCDDFVRRYNRLRPFEPNPVSRQRLSTSSILLITNDKDPLRCTQSRLRASHVTIVATIVNIVAISHRT